MKRAILAFLLAATVSATAGAGYQVVRLGDVIALTREGLSDRTIIAFLETREIAFVVGTDEILRLRDAGAGEGVIRYLIERTAPGGPSSYSALPPRARDDDSAYYDPAYDDPAYHDPGYERPYIDYGPSYSLSASIPLYGGYVEYGHRGGFFPWLGRVLGFGHPYGRRYVSRYDSGPLYGYGYQNRSSYAYGRGYRPGYSYGYRPRYVSVSRPYSAGHFAQRGRPVRYGRGHAVVRGSGGGGGYRQDHRGGRPGGGHHGGRGRR